MAKSPRTLITVPGAARAQVFAEMAGKPQPLEFGDYVRILRERWFAMVVAMLIMLIGAGIYTLSASPVFVAKATLFVTATSADDTAYENSQFARQRVASYPDLVDSPEVLDEVVEDLSLEMTASALAGHVTAVNPKDTVLLEVSADADDATRAADIANAAAKGLSAAIEKVETSPRAGGMTVKAALM
ncbi:MAG TPA: Wzz/FepE/Etk N-terminal domain-containing protein, partial [Arthrobacter sp.]|nr:Wzz/FepE/Etk N-terminal domain-containing protein [Arthrobacter sp.]